ncbi:uncharacterized protein LOC128390603 [Panonychus citri]|uniref:uncharacterized protein LOC128390603 n=1 Tax=Panonychus citri TaxID=50023 RepID=UPI002306F4E8|nr:uncharacterized protein LOC128390603 [Panonychus citri]
MNNPIDIQYHQFIESLSDELNAPGPMAVKFRRLTTIMERFSTWTPEQQDVGRVMINSQLLHLTRECVRIRTRSLNNSMDQLLEQVNQMDKLFNEEAQKNEALHRENEQLRAMLKIKEGDEGKEEISFLTWVMEKMKKEFSVNTQKYKENPRGL